MLHGSLIVAVAFGLLSVSAFASLSDASAASKNIKVTGTLTFGIVTPFSGADAFFGPGVRAGCIPAVAAIKAAGGILGDRNIVIKDADTRGDPVDAVPIVQQLVATTQHLLGVTGPSSDEALAVVPILNQAHIPMFAATGQSFFGTNHDQYFWRIMPQDSDVGLAMALYAHKMGYTRAAVVFGTDIGSQGTVPTLIKAFTHLGGTVVVNQAIPLDQTSYASEVAALIAAKPQVIFTEADAQTSSTYFAELAQANGLRPIISTNATTDPTWLGPVSKAMGVANMTKYYKAATLYMKLSGPGYAAWKKAFLAVKGQEPKPAGQWLNNFEASVNYDDFNIMALAMQAAGSINPQVYNKYIPRVTTASKGAQIVYSFAEGKRALALGKHIQYVGAMGAVAFDKYHNSTGQFEIINSRLQYITSFSAKQVQAAK